MDRKLGSTVPVQLQDLHYIQEKTPNNPKKVFQDNYEPPLALFDIHTSRRNQFSVDRGIFR
jgi:hypothetical protein